MSSVAKLNRAVVIDEALSLLDQVGLDAFTTRGLATRLGVESAALYWHFRDKAALLAEMSVATLARNHTLTPPSDPADWPRWFSDNTRSFRRALLAHRDGARLHAGTTPNRDELERIAPKIAYLVRAGFSKRHAGMAMLAASQFTIGCVMEAQARRHGTPTGEHALSRDVVEASHAGDAAFEFGLLILVEGLRVELGSAKKSRRR